jgi:Na+/H+ antiporter NhaD/arsenite permease-like protein
MSLSIIAFLILLAAFAIGSLTSISAGLLALVAAFGVGTLLADLPIKEVMDLFPSGLFFILVGATLLFGIVRVTGTIDLLAYWAERLAGGRRLLVPVLMFLLTAILASAGAFTPAAIAIVAPVALALGSRFGISTLAMGLVVVQGANAGAFSPVNPFGVLSNLMLDEAGVPGDTLKLYLYCFVFNAVLAVIAYALVQAITNRRNPKDDAADTETAGIDGSGGLVASQPAAGPATGGVATAVAAETTTETAAPTKVAVTPMRVLTLIGLVALLVLTTVFGIDVGVASLVIALALIVVKPSVQKPAIEGMPWSAVLLVTGIVTYVGVLEAMGALADLQSGIESLGSGSVAALITSYVVGIISAFASTTGTLSVISPIVVPIAGDPLLTAIGVVTAVSISSSVVDTSPMSTSGALLMASAQPKDERMFFRALLLWAIGMIAIVPLFVWFFFVYLGIG